MTEFGFAASSLQADPDQAPSLHLLPRRGATNKVVASTSSRVPPLYDTSFGTAHLLPGWNRSYR